MTTLLLVAATTTPSDSTPGGFFLWAIVMVYFMPSVIAELRQKAEGGNGIAFLNLLLGWTVIGWLLCFVWACTGRTKKDIAPEDKQHREVSAAFALNKIQRYSNTQVLRQTAASDNQAAPSSTTALSKRGKTIRTSEWVILAIVVLLGLIGLAYIAYGEPPPKELHNTYVAYPDLVYDQ